MTAGLALDFTKNALITFSPLAASYAFPNRLGWMTKRSPASKRYSHPTKLSYTYYIRACHCS